MTTHARSKVADCEICARQHQQTLTVKTARRCCGKTPTVKAMLLRQIADCELPQLPAALRGAFGIGGGATALPALCQRVCCWLCSLRKYGCFRYVEHPV